MLLTGESVAPAVSVITVDPVAVLKGRLESYMLYGILGDAKGDGPGDLWDENPLEAE